jgi:tol-pal system protein YbgF
MRKIVIVISSALIVAQLLLYPPVTHARVDGTSSGREAEPQGLMESVLYEKALAFCRNGQHKRAIMHFKVFLLYFPQSGLADNAQFWIGECYRAQHMLEEAVAAYQRVIDEYPGGNRVPRAMLNQGFVYLKMDRRVNAKLVLRRLADELPMTEEAKVAHSVLDRVAKREAGRITHLSPDMGEWRILKEEQHDGGKWPAVPEERTVEEEIANVDRVMRYYQIRVARSIKENWSFPFLFFNAKQEEIPEAVVLLTIKNDGTIINVSFKERSQNELFDESILKAIEKSNPLPEFPPRYEKLYDEVEIRFSLKGTLFK